MRELKPGARPIAHKDRDDVAVCAADSRLMAFKSVDESLRFWIKVIFIIFTWILVDDFIIFSRFVGACLFLVPGIELHN